MHSLRWKDIYENRLDPTGGPKLVALILMMLCPGSGSPTQRESLDPPDRSCTFSSILFWNRGGGNIPASIPWDHFNPLYTNTFQGQSTLYGEIPSWTFAELTNQF